MKSQSLGQAFINLYHLQKRIYQRFKQVFKFRIIKFNQDYLMAQFKTHVTFFFFI